MHQYVCTHGGRYRAITQTVKDRAAAAFKAVPLDGGEWCVEFLGHAFIFPEPTQKAAEWLVGELKKDYERSLTGAVAQAVKERDGFKELVDDYWNQLAEINHERNTFRDKVAEQAEEIVRLREQLQRMDEVRMQQIAYHKHLGSVLKEKGLKAPR